MIQMAIGKLLKGPMEGTIVTVELSTKMLIHLVGMLLPIVNI